VNTVGIVFRKELKDQLRDRRTLMFMVVIPLLVFPVLFNVLFSVEKSSREKAKAKHLEVALVAHGNAARFGEIARAQEDIAVRTDVPADSVRSWVDDERIDGGWVFAEDFDERIRDNRPGKLTLYYRSSDENRVIRDRLSAPVDAYEKEILEERFARLGIDEDVGVGIDGRRVNVASMEERIGKQVGGFLPYLFILFCFMGTMYPAIDLGAGEKERGTLETLLTAPVNRFHILIGKLGVVTLSGLVSACVAIAGLYIGFRGADEIPDEFFDLIVKILGWDTIAVLVSLLVPLAIFFAGMLLSVSLSAKSFKEAQSLITPLNLAVILPAAIGMMPGIELTYATALVPVLNVSLATREIIAGTAQTAHLVAVYASLVVFALAALYLASQWFRRESIIFRT
jgi:sodium transport system permease protein